MGGPGEGGGGSPPSSAPYSPSGGGGGGAARNTGKHRNGERQPSSAESTTSPGRSPAMAKARSSKCTATINNDLRGRVRTQIHAGRLSAVRVTASTWCSVHDANEAVPRAKCRLDQDLRGVGRVTHDLKAHTRPERCYLLEMSHKPGTIRAEGAVATRHNGARAVSSYHQIVQCFQDQSKTFSVLGKKEFTSHRNASVARSHTEADWQLTTTVQCKQRVRTSIWMWFMCVGACVRV